MLTVYNGSDKPKKVDGYTIGMGMEPKIFSNAIVIQGKSINPFDYDTVTFGESKKANFTVAGNVYKLGDKVNKGNLFVVGDTFYAADDGGILNKLSSSGAKMIVVVENQCKETLVIGKIGSEVYLNCGEKAAVTGLLHINNHSCNLLPNVKHVVVADRVTLSTYTDCNGKIITQDFSKVYMAKDGSIYYAGRAIYRVTTIGFFGVLLLVFFIVMIITIVFYALYFIFRKHST
jgi:hypothetical protein